MNIDRSKRKIDLETSIISLWNLLNRNIKREEKYQDLFEKNPVIFDVLGYKNFWPITKKSKITLSIDEFTGKKPEPDFIVERKDGLFEIFELKTPYNKNILITSNKYRERFTSEISSYISQIIDYHNYFRNPVNRMNVDKLLGIKMQENLNMRLVLGLKESLDFKEIDSKLKEYKNSIEIIPFDHILNQLLETYNKEFGGYEDSPGISFHAVVRFHPGVSQRRYYFFVVGDKSSDYLSIFIENNELIVEFKPKVGKPYSKSIQNANKLLYSKWVYFNFELGIKNRVMFFSISLNNKEVGREEVSFQSGISINFKNMLLGSDINKENCGIFDDYEKCVYDRVLKFEEKQQLFSYFRKRMKNINQCIQFSGSQFMYTDSNSKTT